MRLNHLDLQVTDVARSVEFFEQIFGLELQSNRRSPVIAILGDGAGFVLVLQRREAVAYPEGFHVGFLVDDVALVHAVHARATAAGLPISPVETDNRSTRTYCRAPEGYLVEVGCPRVTASRG
ncbi:VOC family protein [Nannocystis sp. ILAH1]|uniref:VOC family protein n=1 Tax=unclassified Nannocystis TaxID=2627009 RepID=UPI00226F53AA|nr:MULTISPECIES: VOC family protein [unclassified Nannocystis]MCY0995136.1 VOC family protein [Nannocystis sp. ILAH1]MCY1069924.1 VOC family protein [Nannocystis sp. RBIL2]